MALVLLLARERMKVVAAATGVVKVSYSSKKTVRMATLRVNGETHAPTDTRT